MQSNEYFQVEKSIFVLGKNSCFSKNTVSVYAKRTIQKFSLVTPLVNSSGAPLSHSSLSIDSLISLYSRSSITTVRAIPLFYAYDHSHGPPRGFSLPRFLRRSFGGSWPDACSWSTPCPSTQSWNCTAPLHLPSLTAVAYGSSRSDQRIANSFRQRTPVFVLKTNLDILAGGSRHVLVVWFVWIMKTNLHLARQTAKTNLL